MLAVCPLPHTEPVEDPKITQSDSELRSHVARTLEATYELDREIGRGGMGIVYRARDKRLKRPVAIKLLPPELAFRSEIRSRFLREAETAAQLSHPCIVPIYSVDEKDGLVYFVMAFVDGDNLAKRIHDRGPMDPTEVRRVLRDVGDALAYAHSHGVVHRDIKPDNILLDGPNGRPMVTDFGIARAITDGGDARLTATGIAIGTPAFMSPEQSAGDRDVDGRSDLYSLGVVAYQMLCGDLPFTATNTPALLVKHLSERPVSIDQRRANIPPDLARAVMLCLEKSPEDRFPSAGAFVTALDSGDVPSLPAPRPTMAPSAPSGMPSYAPSTGAFGSTDAYATGSYTPGAAEMDRWYRPEVQAFRKKMGPFLFVGAASLIIRIFGGPNFVGVVGLYGVYLAYKYARLWSDGYDWHDVFKEPRDRLFLDVMTERLEDIQAMWNPAKRERVRERQRLTFGKPGLFEPAGESLQRGISARESAALASGPHAGVARQSITDRDEISRLIGQLPTRERDRVRDVPAAAERLSQSIMEIAAALGDIDRAADGRSLQTLETEIALLESQANPLDRTASEDRVRRLATLKRQRRALAQLDGRRDELLGKLDTLAVALQNMKLDVLRLSTGARSWQQVTSVAEQALALAKDVDNAVYVADELNRLNPRTSGAPRADSSRR
jgi:serine/threonine protein kinase